MTSRCSSQQRIHFNICELSEGRLTSSCQISMAAWLQDAIQNKGSTSTLARSQKEGQLQDVRSQREDRFQDVRSQREDRLQSMSALLFSFFFIATQVAHNFHSKKLKRVQVEFCLKQHELTMQERHISHPWGC